MRFARLSLRMLAAMPFLLFCGQGALAAALAQSDTELVAALGSGNVELVERILADPKRSEPIERSIYVLRDAYALAVESGSVPLLKYLESRGWLDKLKESGSDSVNEMVQVSAMAGRNDVIDYLAAQHVDITAADRELGRTALHSAASSGRVETVRHLCELGLRPDAKTRDGKTALELGERALQRTSRGGPEETAMYKESLRQIVAYLEEKEPDGCVAKKNSAAPAEKRELE